MQIFALNLRKLMKMSFIDIEIVLNFEFLFKKNHELSL